MRWTAKHAIRTKLNLLSAPLLAPLASALLMSFAFESAATETRHLGGGDAWSYSGEVVLRPGSGTCTRIPCGRYCEKNYCAQGAGHLGTDGSWWYDGTFVDGRMEGIGRYENDFYFYKGGFKNNQFDGEGILTCLINGPVFRGIFVHGSLNGESVSWEGPCGD
jgi:hypothetical protein